MIVGLSGVGKGRLVGPRKCMSKKKSSKEAHDHKGHSEITTRLKRISGHLNKVILMVEQDEECMDILQQLTAVISGLTNTRTVLLLDHVNTCFSDAIKPGQEHVLQEIDTIIKRTIKD